MDLPGLLDREGPSECALLTAVHEALHKYMVAPRRKCVLSTVAGGRSVSRECHEKVKKVLRATTPALLVPSHLLARRRGELRTRTGASPRPSEREGAWPAPGPGLPVSGLRQLRAHPPPPPLPLWPGPLRG